MLAHRCLLFCMMVVVCLALVGPAFAAPILYYRIETDAATYGVGDTVNWTVSLATSVDPDNGGLMSVALDLSDSTADPLQENAVLAAWAPGLKITGSLVSGNLEGIGFVDFSMAANGLVVDGNWTTFATGSYVVNVEGNHELSVPLIGAQYWSNAGGSTPDVAGIDGNPGVATFTVTPEPASLSLLGLGGLAMLRRRRRQK